MSGSNYTLAGFLASTTVEIPASKLLSMLGGPVQIAGPSSPTQVALLRSLLVSLRFGSTPFVNPGKAGVCACYASGLPAFGGGGNTPPFKVTQITVVSGVVTLTVPGLDGSNDSLAGLKAMVSFCTNPGNNAGNLAVVSSGDGSLVVTNGGAVTETPAAATLVLNYPGTQGGGLVGGGSGIGDSNDLAPLLVSATQNELVYGNVGGFSGPTSLIAGQPIVLMNPLASIFNPEELTGGDSSLMVTSEYLVVQI